MRNADKKEQKYSHQLYAKDIKHHAELSRLAETGSLADLMKFKKQNADALKEEAQAVRNKRSNFRADLNEGRLKSGYQKGSSKRKAAKPTGALASAFGLTVAGSAILEKAKAAKSAIKKTVSRKHAGPVISDPYLSRLRIQSWYLTLLGNWYPDIAMNLRDHMVYKTLARYYNSIGLELPDEISRLLPALPPDTNAGDLLEEAICSQLRTNSALKNKRYNLKARNYMAGEGHVTDSTVVEFGQIVPDSETVYRLGFEELPMWEVFDGNLVSCQNYAHSWLDQSQIEMPANYAQFVLGILLESDDQIYLAELISSLSNDNGSSTTLDNILSDYGVSEFTEPDCFDLNATGKRVASACLLLLALIQATPTDYSIAHKRMNLLLAHFYLNNHFQNAFGLVFHIFIRQKFLSEFDQL
jgi:hypothetical protein